MKMLKLTVISGPSAVALTACSGNDASDSAATDTEVVQEDAMATDSMVAHDAAGQRNIVALAQGNPQVSTLVTAVTAAGLGETLSGTGRHRHWSPSFLGRILIHAEAQRRRGPAQDGGGLAERKMLSTMIKWHDNQQQSVQIFRM